MSRRLRVNTRGGAVENSSSGWDDQTTGDELEPVSPLTECFLSGIRMANLIVLESQDAIHVPSVCALLNDVGLPLHPRFSSIPILDQKGGHKWMKTDVNVEDHVEIPNLPEDLSKESYNQHFNDYLIKVGNQDLGTNKPLWEVHLFKYPINDSVAGVFIFKVDHAVADGISLMSTIFSLFRRVDDPSLPLPFPASTVKMKKYSISQRIAKIVRFVPKVLSSIFYNFQEFGQNLRLTFFSDDCTPVRSGNSELRPVSIGICTVGFALSDVKKIKAVLGVTINDVLFGTVSLGTRLYMREMNQGRLMNSRSTGVIPINIRSMGGYSYANTDEMRKVNTKVPWGNRISSVEIPIPNVDEDDLKNPLLLVKKAHTTIKRKRGAAFAHLLDSGILAAIKTCGGIKAATRIIERKWANCSVGILNMIGPTEQVSIANHRIHDGYFMTAWKKQTLIVSMGSYMNKLRICLSYEQGFVDQQRLSTCLETAFQMIYQAAMATTTPT